MDPSIQFEVEVRPLVGHTLLGNPPEEALVRSAGGRRRRVPALRARGRRGHAPRRGGDGTEAATDLRAVAQACRAAPCRLVLAAAGFLSSLPGCVVGTYLRDRALDVTDVVDPQVGLGIGLGAKGEVSDYVAAGLGWGYGAGLEFYGRRATKFGGAFLQVPLCGVNELPFDAGGPIEDDFLLYQRKYQRAPAFSRARIGVSLLPVLGYIGLSLNLGEALDLVAGLVGLDPAEDDGVPKGAEMELRVTLHDGWPPKPIGGTESRESQGTREP